MVCLGTMNMVFAGDNLAENDTIQKMPSALPATEKEDPVVLLRKSNVKFPQILAGNETESLAYIEKFAQARKDYLIRTFSRGKKLFPKVVSILKKYNVPAEFRVLLALESGFNANAVSSAGAVGYWQFMDEVAREYGLKIEAKQKALVSKREKKKKGKIKPALLTGNAKPTNKVTVTDERKNFTKSTHAAARYLRDRSRNLNGDWLLIAASYNCGVGNVWNAMQRTGKPSPDFWDIKDFLPAETRAYVMNFITLNVIFNNYETFCKGQLCYRDVTCRESDICAEEELCEDDIVASTEVNDY